MFYVCEYYVCMSVHHVSSWCMQRTEEGFPGPGVTDSDKACGCLELNCGPLEKQAVLLTPEPPLPPPRTVILIRVLAFRSMVRKNPVLRWTPGYQEDVEQGRIL